MSLVNVDEVLVIMSSKFSNILYSARDTIDNRDGKEVYMAFYAPIEQIAMQKGWE